MSAQVDAQSCAIFTCRRALIRGANNFRLCGEDSDAPLMDRATHQRRTVRYEIYVELVDDLETHLTGCAGDDAEASFVVT